MIKNKHRMATASILITVAITGCTVGEQPPATNTTPPEANAPKTIPTGTPGNTQSPKPGTQTQPFNTPLVAASPQPTAGSLMLPTNKDERLNVISQGRTDPFGQIVEPIIPASQLNQKDTQKVPALPPLPTVKKPGTTQSPMTTQPPVKPPITTQPPVKPKSPTVLLPKKPPIKIVDKKPAKPVLPKLISPIVPPVAIKPELPPAPQPNDAKALLVSGIVVIGKVPQAIIKVPDELSSRYVQPGQRLVNGVLVKRIEMSNGANPVVIFEQYGIEVAKQVGEQPVVDQKDKEKDKDTKSPTASLEGSTPKIVGLL